MMRGLREHRAQLGLIAHSILTTEYGPTHVKEDVGEVARKLAGLSDIAASFLPQKECAAAPKLIKDPQPKTEGR